MLKLRNLTKTYANGVRALDGVSLDIPRGMFCLLGPNGAGKSSLMRTLATLQSADEGTAAMEDGNGGSIDMLRDKRCGTQAAGLPAAGFRRLSQGQRRGPAGSFRGVEGPDHA